jgi:PadR family transcriptional regulator PadR
MTIQTLRILDAMLEDPDGAWYGLQLSRAAELKSGTIYPALARLEGYGWLESHWEDIDPSVEGRPRRKLYRLTRDGAATARALVAEARINVSRPGPQRAFVPQPQRGTI